MDTKELKIVAPEGYEIDRTNSTLERIVFKKKDGKPRTWEEFCKRGWTGEEAYIYNGGAAQTTCIKGDHRNVNAVGYVDNIEEAEAFVALMQLRQLRKAWVGEWEPDWNDGSESYLIRKYENTLSYGLSRNSGPLTFPTEIVTSDFFYCFKDLLEQAKMLL